MIVGIVEVLPIGEVQEATGLPRDAVLGGSLTGQDQRPEAREEAEPPRHGWTSSLFTTWRTPGTPLATFSASRLLSPLLASPLR
jgi:hypothetical protein